MSFLIRNDELLEKYNGILEKKGSNSIKKEFNKKYLKTKIKSYNRKINSNLQNI